MEIESIVEYLKDKSILVTGSTGFLGKMFVEKVLRVQPSVKKLYLIVRASDDMSAAQRVQNEMMDKDLFDVLRQKHGEKFDSFISKKVYTVVGDTSNEDLGIKDHNIKELLWKEIDIVVNSAAITNFFERYDVAFLTNVLGAKNVLEFTKRCTKIKMLLHVSTAYVVGAKEGIITEKPFHFGEALMTGLKVDIEEELRIIEKRKNELHAEKSAMNDVKAAMKELGLKRAKLYGLPNTYAFTKVMGEMLLTDLRGDVPLVILRPTIITSIYNDPLPGWIEGERTIDTFIVSYAKGNFPAFLGDPKTVLDLIPGDMVVNAMIVAMTCHSNQNSQFIYHVGSSTRNPFKYIIFMQYVHQYFMKNPQTTSDGMAIMVKRIPIMTTMSSFKRYMFLRYRLPLEVFRMVNLALCCLFSQRFKKLWKAYKYVMLLAEFYAPYSFFKGCFDDANLERLRMKIKDNMEATIFDFDPKKIEWEDYILNVHIPGVLKHA